MDRTLTAQFGKYVSLNILGQMAYSCYTLADTFFVAADLGAEGLTALNLAFPVFCLISGLGLMTGVGGGSRYASARSRGDREAADRVFTHAAVLTGALALVFFLLGCFASGPLTRLLGADPSVFASTHTYLRVLLLFAPAFLCNHLLQCFVRNDGNPTLAMAAMTVGSLCNVVLDYVFIFPWGMGIFGAILATGLAPVIGISILLPYVVKRAGFRLVPGAFRGDVLLGLVSSGVPPLVTELSSGVVMLLFNFILLGLAGNLGVAAFSVITVISLVVTALYTGLSQGIQPLLSQHHGLGNRRAVERILRYALVVSGVMSLVIYGVIAGRAPALTAVFNSEGDAELAGLAVQGMRLYFLACPFLGFSIVTAIYFAATERPRPGQALSLLRSFILLIPAAFLLSWRFGVPGVWCAYPAAEALTALVGIVLLILQRRKEMYS